MAQEIQSNAAVPGSKVKKEEEEVLLSQTHILAGMWKSFQSNSFIKKPSGSARD